MSAYTNLRRRHQLFVDAYVECGVGVHAIRNIGFEGSRPDVAASKLLAMSNIKAAIEERTEVAIAAAGITKVRTLQEVARVAYFDHRKLFDPDGKPLPIHQLDKEVVAGLAGIEIEEFFEGSGEERTKGRIRKYRAFNKTEALKLLMQYQKLLTERHEHTGAGGGPIETKEISDLEKARRIAFLLAAGMRAQASTVLDPTDSGVAG